MSVTGFYVVVMALAAFAPLGDLLFVRFLKLDADWPEPARQCFTIICLGPLVIAIRNIFHGEVILKRRTRGWAKDRTCRIAAVLALSWILYRAGGLNHATGAAVMIAGFAFEALGAYTSMRKLARR